MGESTGEELTEALARPEAYPWAVERVELLQTHISWLFFAGDLVLKVKKPVELDFLDYGTLERRRHFCEEEVRLNRRLANGVYHGVVPVTRTDAGELRVEGEGETVEWAVKMTRLPEDGMLSTLVDEGRFGREQARDLVGLLVRFHEDASTGERVDEHGSPAAVAKKVLDNLDELGPFAGEILSPPLLRHLGRRARAFLGRRDELLRRRQRHGRIREGHGDLHAGNICFRDEHIVVYDCVEFSRELRCGDVASDLAFLAMDLDHRGYPRHSEELVEAYASSAGDDELRELIPFYKGYRAAVRAKVAALAAAEPGSDERRTVDKRVESRRYLQLAAGYGLPPTLILTCGLPATGKSWAARKLARPLRAEVLRSDVERKRLAGVSPDEARPAGWRQGIYTEEMTRLTYDRLLEAALAAIGAGRTVIVDASFATRELRRPFLSAAAEAGCRSFVLHVTAPGSLVRRRLERRRREDGASDAGIRVYEQARESFDPPREVDPRSRVTSASGSPDPEDLVGAVIERLLDREGR